MEKKNMFQLARMILRNECPPDNRMYLCRFGEEMECRCTECWDNYLFYAVNGYDRDPYETDRKINRVNQDILSGKGLSKL